MLLSEITPGAIEVYIERRLNEGKRTNTKLGLVQRGKVKPATVHQEFRVLRHVLNVAIRQKKLQVNPCSAVEFPAMPSRNKWRNLRVPTIFPLGLQNVGPNPISVTSKRRGEQHSGAQPFRISRYTSCGIPSRQGSAPEEYPTTLSL